MQHVRKCGQVLLAGCVMLGVLEEVGFCVTGGKEQHQGCLAAFCLVSVVNNTVEPASKASLS
jgi:hypothetical protein